MILVLFLPILRRKETRHRSSSMKLHFRFLCDSRTGRCKEQVTFWMDLGIFRSSWGISMKICIVDTYRKSKNSIMICIEPKSQTICIPNFLSSGLAWWYYATDQLKWIAQPQTGSYNYQGHRSNFKSEVAQLFSGKPIPTCGLFPGLAYM